MEFPVYKISPNQGCYMGNALVAASNAAEANEFIDSFKEHDKHNDCDSWGYGHVDEDDRIDCLFSTVTGIIDYGIWYRG
jgi:hypothetical protein